MSRPKRTKFSSKYVGGTRDEFVPGTRNRVLKNLLDLKTVHEIENVELVGYMKAERSLVEHFGPDHSFTVRDINLIQQMFLGSIYEWAGNFRNVDLAKGGFPFATAYAIPRVMPVFEHEVLGKNTPCKPGNLKVVAARIAVVHTELLLIHPYREGNGRTARLLATFMAYQAGLPGIDFGLIGSKGKQFERYIKAIQAGLDKNYKPMTDIVLEALQRAERLTSET